MKHLLQIQRRGVLGFGVGVLMALVQFAGWLRPLEELTIDWRLRLRPAEQISDKVRLIGIGDRDVGQALGRWPFPRAVHADILKILHVAGVRHCSMDVLFTEASGNTEHDQQLVEAIRTLKNITLAYHFEEAGLRAPNAQAAGHFINGNRYGLDVSRFKFVEGTRPVAPFAPIPCSFGAVNALPDADGIIRRVPLFIEYDGRLFPSLAMQTLIAGLGVEPDQVHIEPGSAVTIVGVQGGTLRIPVDERCQYRVNFAGDIGVFAPAFQYADVYGALNAGENFGDVFRQLKDRIVLIGNISTGNSDVVTTSIGRLPGVAIQAMVVSNILSGSHLKMPAQSVQCLILILLCGLCGATMRPTRPWVNVILLVTLMALWSALCFGLTRYDWIAPLVPVLAGMLCTGLAMLGLQVTQGRREKARAVETLGAYVPQNLVKTLIQDGVVHKDATPVPNERKELTIFSSGIRGFNVWAERMEPDDASSMLNEYFSAMVGIAERHGGTVDKLMGDSLMVFFGAPTEMADHPIRAVRMALDMQGEVKQMNAKWVQRGKEPLLLSMGIHTSFATVGNFGTSIFRNYTAVGRGVNLANQIQSWVPEGKILLSATTQARVQNEIQTRIFAELKVAGIADPVPVFELLAVSKGDTVQSTVQSPNYWIAEDGRETGPFFAEAIDLMRQCGRIGPSTAIRTDGPQSGALTASVHRYRAFISYRRKGGSETARVIRQELHNRGVHTFLDVDDLSAGHFDDRLLREIEEAPNFIVILNPGCLNRRGEKEEWMHREIEHAIRKQRNIIPIFRDGFSFDTELEIPENITDLRRNSGVHYNHELFSAMLDKITAFLRSS